MLISVKELGVEENCQLRVKCFTATVCHEGARWASTPHVLAGKILKIIRQLHTYALAYASVTGNRDVLCAYLLKVGNVIHKI